MSASPRNAAVMILLGSHSCSFGSLTTVEVIEAMKRVPFLPPTTSLIFLCTAGLAIKVLNFALFVSFLKVFLTVIVIYLLSSF